jgi:hypothetical protein
VDALQVAETTNWVPAVTAGVGALAAIGGQLVAGLFQRRNQERIEQRERRDRAARVLAEVTALYNDSSPDLIRDSDDPASTLEALFKRSERVRMPLLMLATAHPSTTVRLNAGKVEGELATSLIATRLAVLSGKERTSREWERARGFQADLKAALSELVGTIHQT